MKLKITQTKSTLACLNDQIAKIKALGLNHVGHTVVKEDNLQGKAHGQGRRDCAVRRTPT